MANAAQAQAAAKHFTAENQHVFIFPNAPHGTMMQTPTYGRVPCGAQLVTEFLKDPTASLNTQCLQDLQPVHFNAPASYNNARSYSQERFGTEDLWATGTVNCPRDF
jgi:hypothetical protein